MSMSQLGIVHDGQSVRFMTASERELFARQALPKDWIVIVPPSADDAIIPCEEVPNGEANSRGDFGSRTDGRTF